MFRDDNVSGKAALSGQGYHGPRNYYVNNSQRNNSCNCNCSLAAKIILLEIIYVIVIDGLSNGKQRHMQKLFLSTIIYVIVIVRSPRKGGF